MPEKEQSLLEALTAGMPGGVADDPPETEEEVETPEGEETETPEGEEEAEQPEGEEEAEAEGEEGEEAEEGEEEDPEAAAAAAAAAKKPVDLINDPLPRGTLQQTSERFKHVVDKLKEQTTAREELQVQHDELIGSITNAGMDGNTFNAMLEYAQGVNSGTYEGLQKSYKFLLEEVKSLATALGEPLPGVSPVDAHADLIKEVNEKTLTPQRATEIALDRNRRAAQTKMQASQTGAQQSAQHSQREQAAGKTALTALGKELAAKDGKAEYVRKAGLVVGMLKETLPNLSPKLWVKAFRSAYDQVPAAQKAPVGKIKPKPQPMRGNKVPSGQSAKQPKSLLQAVRGAFGPAD